MPPDEHSWIEQFGCTRRYRKYRNGIRQYYREHYPLTSEALRNPFLNPGGGHVSRLCHEPRAGVAVIEQMMAFARMTGRLRTFMQHRPVKAEMSGDRITQVTVEHVLTGDRLAIPAKYFLDATELGDLLPLAGAEYVSGAESRDDTGEPHAVEGAAQPDNVQAFTWCFAMSHEPGEHHVIDKPEQYEYWRDYVPTMSPPWPGKLIDWTVCHPMTLEPDLYTLFPTPGIDPFGLFLYRQIVAGDHYRDDSAVPDVSLVNWPQNDYWGGNIIDKPPEVVAKYLNEARQLSLSLFYWLQTEAPHPDGVGQGYPGLYLRPDIMGTDDGLAMYPYIRESRRIKAVFTVTENHVGVEAAPNPSAALFEDSVGVGCARIDLHPGTTGTNFIDVAALPFHVPLGAMIPIRIDNLVAAAKNIGTTHISNGSYRLHPTEWSIGEAAGLLAAYCLDKHLVPRAVREQPENLNDFQNQLKGQGFDIAWPKVESSLPFYWWRPPPGGRAA